MNTLAKSLAALLAVVVMSCNAGIVPGLDTDAETGCRVGTYADTLVPAQHKEGTGLVRPTLASYTVDPAARLGSGIYPVSLASTSMMRLRDADGTPQNEPSSVERLGQNLAATPALVQTLMTKSRGIVRLDGGNEPPTSLLLLAGAAVMLYVARRRRVE